MWSLSDLYKLAEEIGVSADFAYRVRILSWFLSGFLTYDILLSYPRFLKKVIEDFKNRKRCKDSKIDI